MLLSLAKNPNFPPNYISILSETTQQIVQKTSVTPRCIRYQNSNRLAFKTG